MTKSDCLANPSSAHLGRLLGVSQNTRDRMHLCPFQLLGFYFHLFLARPSENRGGLGGDILTVDYRDYRLGVHVWARQTLSYWVLAFCGIRAQFLDPAVMCSIPVKSSYFLLVRLSD